MAGGAFTAQQKLGSRDFHLYGLEEFKKMVEDISPKRAHAIAKNAVHAVAGDAKKEMRKKAPKKTGTLRKAIITKKRRGKPGLAVSDVRITHGKNVKYDAWYWLFVEFGTVKQAKQPFIRPTIDKIQPQIPQLFREHFGKKVEKELEKQARIQGVIK